MTRWQLIAKAVQDPNAKLTCESWMSGEYVYYDPDRDGWIDETGSEFIDIEISTRIIKEYKEPAKPVTWYRPYIVWYRHKSEPEKFNGSNLFNRYKDVNEWTNARVVRVLEWEEREFPATYDECEDVTDE